MDDVELKRRCAASINIRLLERRFRDRVEFAVLETNESYNPLCNRAQAFDLITLLKLSVHFNKKNAMWHVYNCANGVLAINVSLTRAVANCAARIPEPS